MVDDLLIIGKNVHDINELILKLTLKLFENDIRVATNNLVMRIVHTSQEIVLCQRSYVHSLVSDMGLKEISSSRIPCDT